MLIVTIWLDAFTGCDLNRAFYRQGKKIPYRILKQLQFYVETFTDLANLNNCDIHELQKTTLEFICKIHGFEGINDECCYIYESI